MQFGLPLFEFAINFPRTELLQARYLFTKQSGRGEVIANASKFGNQAAQLAPRSGWRSAVFEFDCASKVEPALSPCSMLTSVKHAIVIYPKRVLTGQRADP